MFAPYRGGRKTINRTITATPTGALLQLGVKRNVATSPSCIT